MSKPGDPCTKCGKTEPEVEFYDYSSSGGRRLPECKSCQCLRQRTLQAAERNRNAADAIAYLRRCQPRTRHNRVYEMIRKGTITKQDFRVVLESGQIPLGQNWTI